MAAMVANAATVIEREGIGFGRAKDVGRVEGPVRVFPNKHGECLKEDRVAKGAAWSF